MEFESIVEQLEQRLDERRNTLTLLRAPFRTARLALYVVVRWLGTGFRSILSHPLSLYVAGPLLLLFLTASIFLVPHQGSRVFAFYDSNGDGVISAEEFVGVTRSRFGTEFDVPSVNATMSEYFTDPAHHLLTEPAFQRWWEAGDDAAREKHRFPYHPVREVEFFVADIVWWVGLGVLSSIGLGTGMHSGLLFLFPHIYLTCAAVEACGHTNFWTYPTNRFWGPSDRVFECISAPTPGGDISVWSVVLKVLPWCVLWGSGTALGEIPPYALSYAAALEGKQTDELNEVSSFDIVNRMKYWMLDKIKRYGFWAILALAAWPNMAFDLCGMACGQFLLPFWTFFGATFIGKAIIKVNGQAFFFVLLFSGDGLHNFIALIGRAVQAVVPTAVPVDRVVAAALKAVDDTRHNIERRAKGTFSHEAQDGGAGAVQMVLSWLVFAAVAWFAKSIVDTFAQKRQKELDDETVAAARKRFGTRAVETNADQQELQRSVFAFANLSAPDPVAVWSDEFISLLTAASIGVALVTRSMHLAVVGGVLVLHSLLWVTVAHPSLKRRGLTSSGISQVRVLSLLPVAIQVCLPYLR